MGGLRNAKFRPLFDVAQTAGVMTR
jgi:hypothetical protein